MRASFLTLSPPELEEAAAADAAVLLLSQPGVASCLTMSRRDAPAPGAGELKPEEEGFEDAAEEGGWRDESCIIHRPVSLPLPARAY